MLTTSRLAASSARSGLLSSSSSAGAPPALSRSLFTRSRPPPSRARTALTWTVLATLGTFGVAYHLDSRAAIHRWLAIPVLKATLDPEAAQKLAVAGLASGIMPRDLVDDDEVLATELFSKRITNPIGLAAGFDKQGEAIDGLFNLGFGIVEIGSVTPKPQPGNPQPRYFRLSADEGAINRFGFNSDGHDVVLARLRDRVRQWASQAINHGATPPAASLREGQLLAINLGKNKASAADDVSDYVEGVKRLGPFADIVVINISSPNTPGLRALQRKEVLAGLMKEVKEARDGLPQKPSPPLLVKIAPDLDQQELADIADAALASGIDGLIVSNTTVSRPATLRSPEHVVKEAGGLSGKPVKPLALRALREIKGRVGDRLTLIGCGGIFSGQDALDFARAGASAVELYTSFGYEGVGHPRRLKDDLVNILKAEKTSWAKEVGRDVKKGEAKFGEEVNEVKGEIAGLREKFGSAKRSFRPDPADVEYTGLLGKINEVLGVVEEEGAKVGEPVAAVGRAIKAGTQPQEKIEAGLKEAGVIDAEPQVAISAALAGSLPDATVGAGQSPVSTRPAEDARSVAVAARDEGDDKEKKGSSGKGFLSFGGKSSSSGGKQSASTPSILDKPVSFKVADAQRVV